MPRRGHRPQDPPVEGMLAVQMVDSGVAADGTSRGINLFSVDDGTTVYQLIKTEGTKYTNLVVDEQSVAWQLGRRYRFVGPVFRSLPAEYAKTPKLMPGEKPLAFVVASEVILLDEQPDAARSHTANGGPPAWKRQLAHLPPT